MKRLIALFAGCYLGLGVLTLAQRADTDQAQVALRAAMQKEVVDGDIMGAIERYRQIVDRYGRTNRAVAAAALLQMARAYEKLGDAGSQKAYERLVRDFGDQKEATEARTRLASLQSRAASQTGPTTRLLWTGQADSLSLDGRYLSFTADTSDVAIRDLLTGTNRLLNNTPGDWGEYDGGNVLSPDGRQIAYAWYIDKDAKDKVVELRVASIVPGEPVRTTVVLRNPQNETFYPKAWMPGGKELLVLHRLNQAWQIGIVTIDGGSFRSIKSLEWRRPDLLSLSPDGRYIAYDAPAADQGSPRDIFVLATDGSRETPAVRNPANDSSPLWAPDGSKLIFLSNRTGSIGLWALPIDDGRPNGEAVLLKPDIGAIRPAGMAKSGALYYFLQTTTPRNLFVADLDNAVHATKPVAATERLIDNNRGAAWSRDGQYLAYYSVHGGTTVLVVRLARTGVERTVVLPARLAGGRPRWFPDNRSVLVAVNDAEGNGGGFYRLTLDTGNTELLVHVPRGPADYDLSSDGGAIVYAIEGDGARLMRFDIERHAETELRRREFDGWAAVAIAVSPDGSQVATTIIGGRVEVRPAAGGPAREVFRPDTGDELGTGSLRNALTWTPDQRFLLWVRGDGTLWRVPAAGGTAEKVGIPMSNVKNLAVYPDGKQLFFDGLKEAPKRDMWALENFLPAANGKTAR